jgi:ATP-dependent HslUV protease ATP-binding subunit HslU
MPSPRTVRALQRTAELTPRRIVAELDRHIIGQDAAKKAVAIALRNRWRRQQAPEAMRVEINPNNIILIGPTGSGKTEIARRLAKLAGAPFVKVEASKFTEVGYVGRDVESLVRDLVENAITLVRDERKGELESVARERVEERLLDALLPAIPEPSPSKEGLKEPAAAADRAPGFFVAGASGPAVPVKDDPERDRHQRTREKMRALLREGTMEDRRIEIELPVSAGPMLGMMTPQGAPEGMEQFQQALQDMLPRRTKKRSMTVGEARRTLLEQEYDRLLDRDDLVAEAVERAEETGIVFLDEVDKIAGAGRGQGSGPDVSREGVQRDLLPIVEGSTVSTKYGAVRTDKVLFIAAGAFHVAKPSDLIPELQGRFPIRVELQPLTEGDFVRIMTEPDAALTRQYAALVAAEGSTLTFAPDGIAEVAKVAARANQKMENIGARRLHTVLTTLLEELLFALPEHAGDGVTVDAAMVRARLGALVEDEDLRRYIL